MQNGEPGFPFCRDRFCETCKDEVFVRTKAHLATLARSSSISTPKSQMNPVGAAHPHVTTTPG
jgi:hypothetical protein